VIFIRVPFRSLVEHLKGLKHRGKSSLTPCDAGFNTAGRN